ncbi:MAG: PAS domain S-box protein [Herminiimonas sp.]|nr:PAS domain S-box protein [Herminiimonas sp.]
MECNLGGTVITANENFLRTVGFSLDEIVGKHHRMFCRKDHAASAGYADFWEELGAGQFDLREYRRIAKDGREIWLNASYNPIFDADGVPFKVVKFASDVTAVKMVNVEFEGKVSAIDKAQAVIEFDMNGFVLDANENFLAVMGYVLSDIKGEHHRNFCQDDYAVSAEYKRLWQKLKCGEFDSGRWTVRRSLGGTHSRFASAAVRKIFHHRGGWCTGGRCPEKTCALCRTQPAFQPASA